MTNRKRKLHLPLGILAVLIGALSVVFVFHYHGSAIAAAYFALNPSAVSFVRATSTPEVTFKPLVEHVATPEPLKAIYMTQCYAGTPSLRAGLVKLVDESELNSIVIDLKDYSGTVSFPSKTALEGTGCTVSDFRAFIKELHDRDIYVIGRLTVFQDPLYTKAHPEEAVQSIARAAPWKDRKGLSFVDVGSLPFRYYIVTLAREAHDLGVDEINFDYIRYPSDGNMQDTSYTKTTRPHPEELELFFKELTTRVRAEQTDHMPILSADLFGMTTTNTDDLNIGQVLERTLPYFDYIAPMVYPSHYPSGFHGYADVNKHSYDIVYYAMSEAARRTVATTTPVEAFAHERIGTSTPPNAWQSEAAGEHSAKQNALAATYSKPTYLSTKMRPWLQDFDYPVEYTPAMVQEQITATYDAGLTSWMFWDPANRYSSLRAVLESE